MEADREIESYMFSITDKQEKMNITSKITYSQSMSAFSPWMPGNQYTI